MRGEKGRRTFCSAVKGWQEHVTRTDGLRLIVRSFSSLQSFLIDWVFVNDSCQPSLSISLCTRTSVISLT